MVLFLFLKKNQNTPRPSEHPPVMGEKMFVFVWCLKKNNVQHNGGFLPGIIMWAQCYCHRGTRLNAMKRFCFCSLSMIPPKRFYIFSPLTEGC